MKLFQAQELAEQAKAELAGSCHRIEIAGSIRRQKPEVGDIELICVPSNSLLMDFVAVVRKWPKIKGRPTGKYTQRVYRGMKLDLFICTPATWACNFAIRTGSADFSHGLALRARSVGLQFRNARLWRVDPKDSTQLFALGAINEEADVFAALEINWVEPVQRVDEREIVPLASRHEIE